jgi:hypothetical protein
MVAGTERETDAVEVSWVIDKEKQHYQFRAGGIMSTAFAMLTAFLKAHAAVICLKLFPVALFGGLILIEWHTSSVFGRAGLVILVLSAIIATLDIAGKLPTISASALASRPIDSTR